MTIKQCERFAKGLLPELPGFVNRGRMLFSSPVKCLLRGLYFENTSDANYFHLWVFFLPVFVPTDQIYFNYGNRIGSALSWRLDNPALKEDLRSAVHLEAVPFLARVSSIGGAAEYLQALAQRDKDRVNSDTLEALAYSLIKNRDYSAALSVLGKLEQSLANATVPWILEIKRRVELIHRKLVESTESALAQLRLWESETKVTLKLEL